MTRRLAAGLAALALSAVSVLTSGCGRAPEEARVRALLKTAVALAEKGKTAELMDLFLPDFADFEGRDKAAEEELIRGYLDGFRGVVIHLLSVRMEPLKADGPASVECEMSFSHGAAQVLRKLIRWTGSYYRFRLDLEKSVSGDWRFAYAEWREVGLADLFPESLELLRKLFPDLGGEASP